MENNVFKEKEEKAKRSMTAQAKLILVGLLISTFFILTAAWFTLICIDRNMNNAYRSFGQVLSKTLAIEGMEITEETPASAKADALKSNSTSILKSNDDLSFIVFRDKNNKIIYSSKDDFSEKAEMARVITSSPMVMKKGEQNSNIGSVEIGLAGNVIDNISSAAKVSVSLVFLLAWLVIAGIVYMNSSIITSELRKLYLGVKKISSGEFGYTIENENVGKEVKELYSAFNDMSEKLNRYNEHSIESLTYERNKLESVLMSIVNGVLVCDNQDNVILVNKHAKLLLEVQEENIVGTQIQQFCDSTGEFCFADKIARFKASSPEDSNPVPFNITVDKRIIKCIISPMYSRSNSYIGYVIVLIDVTKEVEMDELRSHFISNVSHELRTPVTVLRSYIDTLYNYGDDFDFNSQREFIGVINQEIIRLNRMVNDILDFSRYESQNMYFEKTKQDIMNIIEDGVNQLQVLAKEHDLTVSVMKEPDLPDVYMNVDSISRAFVNILSNAIKYSPDGKRIKIRAERSRDGEYVEVSVEDQGPGIPEKYQKNVFDRFFRVENDAHTVKGTGLGLHLVKVTIEKHHNGQVFVRSKEGEGSVFGFRLPINVSKEDEEQYLKNAPEPVENEV